MRIYWLRQSAGVALATLAMVGSGCDSPGVSSSTTEASVSGIVTVIGKPATGGKISFNPANVARKDAPAQTAEIGKDGRYTIKTLVGRNQVILFMPGMERKVDLLGSRKSIEVVSGENTCDIDVKALSAAKR